MANHVKDESYPTINAVDSSKIGDVVYVNIDGDKSLKTLESGEPLFRIDPQYGLRKHDTSNKVIPASKPDKIKNENHEKEQDCYKLLI